MDTSSLQSILDHPAPVRPGEELDLEALAGYLRAQLGGPQDTPLEILQFPSGHSNLTYLLRWGRRELVLRRPPFGARIKTAHDMGREYEILSRLFPVYGKVPRPLVYCAGPEVIGAPFYVMDRLQGIILRAAPPPGLELTPARMQALSESFVDNLVEIHRIDFAAAGLGELGHPEGYVQRQVEGWARRYRDARTDDIPEMERAASWLAENLPPEAGTALIHNDYKYDNLVLDPHDFPRILGVLDWEMATLGDPLMDLGTSLGYWIDPGDPPELRALGFGLTSLPGNLERRALAERYARQTGCDLAHLPFYYTYALFKIAVIVQQIYARYKAGFTRDERFAGLVFAVQVLGRMAVRVIEKGRIEDLE